jgi:phenylacetate-CoA ligase
MIVVRGVNVFPAAVEAVLQRCGGVSEYQVEIFSEGPRNELTLRFEALPGEADVAGLAQTLQKALHDALSLRIPVTPVPPGSLPRSEMKARRWVRR